MRRVKKSRTGCARCKSKRVKCGEEKPHCTRCTRLGVRCPGYAQSLRWVTKYEQSNPAVPASISEVRTPSPAASTVPSQLANQIHDVLPDDSTFESAHEIDPSTLILDGRTALCDNLWEHSGPGSLPELTDLCSPSPKAAAPSSFSLQRDIFYDFAQSEDIGVDLSHLLSLLGPTPSEELVDNVYQDFSPSAIVRSYPPVSHRSTPHNFMSMSSPLNNPSWTLIEYYFKEVAALFSSYDSQMNPFRTTVSRLWGSSLAMCRTMQSMAAATLVTEFPQFGPMGRKMRDEAVEIITREAVIDDKSLLALLMLGQTASWHDPKDLGISFFNLLRKQLNGLASSSHNPQKVSNNYRFFEEALIYWEMLLSFVADNDAIVLSDNSRTASSMGESFVLQRVPHPWTGIARDTQFTVHEVGKLIRGERKRIYSRRFTSQDDITRAKLAIEKARELEERLLGLAHPSEAEIVSPGDDDTPVWHLLTMAEAYRCVGLLQLYRIFPDLLHNRLPTSTSTSPQHPSNTEPASQDLFFPIDLDSMNLSAGFGGTSPGTGQTTNARYNPPSPSTKSAPHNLYHLSPHHPPSPPSQDTQKLPTPETIYNSWLTEFAVTTLSRLKTIPQESRTRCLQPFLLVASCSELRLPRLATKAGTQPRNGEDDSKADTDSNNPNQTPTISMEAIEVSRTRKFILGRLTSFLHVLPPKPIHVCLKLVNEVWKRLDAGDMDTYWVDVMIEKGWETTMG